MVGTQGKASVLKRMNAQSPLLNLQENVELEFAFGGADAIFGSLVCIIQYVLWKMLAIKASK